MDLIYLGMFCAIALFALVSRGLAGAGVTMPIVFLALGLLAGMSGLELHHADESVFHYVAEATLALLLFADATMLRADAIRSIERLAARMLLIGLPLAILFGLLANLLLLPGWPIWELCLLAALLAPTDAALGQSVMSNPKIPERLRDILNAESGLNDGLALPFVVFFACLAVGGQHDAVQVGWVEFVLRQIGLGVLVGIAVGGAAGWLHRRCAAAGLTAHGMGRIAALATVGIVYFAAKPLIGNSFVAVFCAGAAFGLAAGAEALEAEDTLETQGTLLAILSFFFVGALFGGDALAHLSPVAVLLVLVSLFVVRPLAIWLSLAGSGLAARDRLFLGWFGPRGLATALFTVFVFSDFHNLTRGDEILAVAVTAVMVSAVLHGISARFGPPLFGYGGGSSERATARS